MRGEQPMPTVFVFLNSPNIRSIFTQFSRNPFNRMSRCRLRSSSDNVVDVCVFRVVILSDVTLVSDFSVIVIVV